MGPVNVTGVMRANRARVIYEDGRLFIFQTATRHAVFETYSPVGDNNGSFSAELRDGSGEVTFTRHGCSTCGYSLGRIPKEQLLAVVV